MVEGCTPFEILLPISEQDAFAEYLTGGGKVEDVLSKIDIRKAEAFKPSDQANINRLVAESMGHGRLNELVTTEMRKWFLSTAQSVLSKMTNDERLISELQLNITKMNIVLGRLGEAETALVSRQEKQLALGAESNKIAETLCELGTVKWKLGQLESALSVLIEARQIYGESSQGRSMGSPLSKSEMLLGDITNRIGTVLYDQGKFADAMQSYTESLAIRSRCFGDGRDMATTFNNIGNVEDSLGNFTKAIEYHEKALEIRTKCFGLHHVDVAMSEKNIGVSLIKKGDLKNALIRFKKALEIEEKCLGRHHVEVARTEKNIGVVVFQIGDHENALIRYKKALDIEEKCLGRHHAVADTNNNIGEVYSHLGDLEKAMFH